MEIGSRFIDLRVAADVRGAGEGISGGEAEIAKWDVSVSKSGPGIERNPLVEE
jgi:hypothetical protein